MVNGKTVDENLVALIAKIGEKITIGKTKTVINEGAINSKYLQKVHKKPRHMSGVDSGFNMQTDIFKSSGLGYGEHTSFGFDEPTGIPFGFDLSADGCVKRGGRRQSFARLPELLLDGLFDDVHANDGLSRVPGQHLGNGAGAAEQIHNVLTRAEWQPRTLFFWRGLYRCNNFSIQLLRTGRIRLKKTGHLKNSVVVGISGQTLIIPEKVQNPAKR